jgi:hypothetical protein
MALRRRLGRAGVITGAASALVLLGSTAASAHHGYIPMYSLQGPQSSNWMVFTVEDAAAEFGGFDACEAQAAAGYAALEEAGLPVGIKIFEKMTLGDGMQGKGKGDDTNPNGANSVGLEFFGHESPLADDALATFIEAGMGVACP